MNQYLQEIVNDNIRQIDAILENDPKSKSEHLHNFLETVKTVYENAAAYGFALDLLYKKDPYMNKAGEAISSIVFMICGKLPQVKWCFKEDVSDQEFVDYIFEVQDQVIAELAEHYSSSIICNFNSSEEKYELTLKGVVNESNIQLPE